MSADMNIDQGDNSRIPGTADFSARAAPSDEAPEGEALEGEALEGEALGAEAPGVSVAAGAGSDDDAADGGTAGVAGVPATAGVGGAGTPAGCCASAIEASEITASAVIDLRMVLNITAPSPDPARACAYAG
jgi:hypothetical protein